MTKEEMEGDGEAMEVEGDGVEVKEPLIISIKVLSLIREQQQKHGLRHSDYQRYRNYCSRRLRRLRKAVGLVQGEKKKFNKKDVTEDIIAEEKHLQIPLVTAERAWAYYMQLKFESNSDPRKKFHMMNRLRKANKYSEQLDLICRNSDKVDARTKLETQAYHHWICGTLHTELGSNWAEAKNQLTQAKQIYESLSLAVGEEEGSLFKQKIEEITPSLRYCAYNIGDASVASLSDLRTGGTEGLEGLMQEARKQQAATLQDVDWRGRKMAVKHEKVRLFMLSYQESGNELSRAKDNNAKVAIYEALLLDCKDALQVLRDELLLDPEFRSRQQATEGKVGSQHFLYTYLQYIRNTATVSRDLARIDSMKAQLEGREKQVEGKKSAKPQDVVRMYENIIQCLSDVTSLPGLENDDDLAANNDSKMTFYKAFRSYYVAQAYINALKWPEAMAVFQRATQHSAKARRDPNVAADMKTQLAELERSIEGRQFVAHANSILETETVTDQVATLDLGKKKPLVDRLDQYYEDPDLVKGKPNLVNFPPEFSPIPCKPLFYDLALYHLEMPSLEEKLASSGSGGGAASKGWFGGWWGGKK